MQLTCKSYFIINLMSLDGNGEDTVRTGGDLVEGSGTHLPDEVTHHQQVQSFLFVHDVYYVYVFQPRVVKVVFLKHQNLRKLSNILCSIVPVAVLSAFCQEGHKLVRCIFP